MKGKEIKETRSWIKEHIRELQLSATFVASNKPAEKCDRRLKFNSDTIKHF